MRRYELTDDEWAIIEPLLPPPAATGRPRRAPREMWNAIFWVLRSGAPWRDLPERFGPWESAYSHFNTCRRKGVVRAGARGAADPARCGGPHRLGSVVCGRHVSARFEGGRRGREKGGSTEPRDHALGRSRGGFGSKIHLVAESHGIPLAAHVTAGQVNECTELEAVVNRVQIGRRRRPEAIAGDKGYSTDRIRRWLRRHAMRAVIPRRSDQHPEDGRGVSTGGPTAAEARWSSATAGSRSAVGWPPGSRSWPSTSCDDSCRLHREIPARTVFKRSLATPPDQQRDRQQPGRGEQQAAHADGPAKAHAQQHERHGRNQPEGDADQQVAAPAGQRIVFPSALCASSAARMPVMFCESSTGFTSTRSSATMFARSLNISMARWASR